MDNLDTSELFAQYPRIAVKIKALWGTKECRDLLMSLLNDSRDGKRSGFPVSIGQTLMALLTDHDAKFPRFDNKHDSIIPFTAVRPRTVIVKPKSDWGFLGSLAKFLAFVLIAAFLYKYFKNS